MKETGRSVVEHHERDKEKDKEKWDRSRGRCVVEHDKGEQER